MKPSFSSFLKSLSSFWVGVCSSPIADRHINVTPHKSTKQPSVRMLLASGIGDPGVLADLFALTLRMFPITVTSLHSPGDTPCSKYPEGCINMTPFVVKPSDSLVAPDDHVGAIVCQWEMEKKRM
jgi:hypothetical protein